MWFENHREVFHLFQFIQLLFSFVEKTFFGGEGRTFRFSGLIKSLYSKDQFGKVDFISIFVVDCRPKKKL